MGWADYWLPQLVSWIGSAVVGFVVGFVLRRWLRQMSGQQQAAANQATQAAATAAEQATAAATHSAQSKAEVAEAVVFLAEQLTETQAARSREASRHDETFGALLRTQALLEQQQARFERYIATNEIRQQHASRQETSHES